MPILAKYGTLMHLGPLHPVSQNKFRDFKNQRWQTATILRTKHCHLYLQNFMETLNDKICLLKTGNKTANINVKKLQFIDTVNDDRSKTAKS